MYRGLPFEEPVSYNIPEEGVPQWAKKDEECSIDQAQYFGMIKCIDDNVGKILQYLSNNGRWIAVVTSRYKLVLSRTDAPWLLDLEKDPFELTNHISIPENKAVVNQMAAKLQEYNLKYNDPFLKETRMEADLVRLLAK